MIGRRQGAFGRVRGFDGVNVVVQCSEVIGVPLHDGFERGDNFFSAGAGRSVLMPQAPRVQIHAGFGKQGGGVEIVGVILRNFAHGVVIVFGGFLQIGLGIGGKALGHGGNVGAFGLGGIGAEVDRFLDRFVRLLETVFTGGIVVVGANGLGDAPVGHGEFGIEFGGLLEGARGFIVVEGVDQAESLIEEFLCCRSSWWRRDDGGCRGRS